MYRSARLTHHDSWEHFVCCRHERERHPDHTVGEIPLLSTGHIQGEPSLPRTACARRDRLAGNPERDCVKFGVTLCTHAVTNRTQQI